METNLWHEIGNKCLENALAVLNFSSEHKDWGLAEEARKFVDIALAIDTQDFRWEELMRRRM